MAEIKRWTVSEPYIQMDCGLGEAPFYDEATHHLRFVDIVEKKLHIVDLAKGPSSLLTLDLEDAVSITADIEGSENEEIIVGAKYGYATLNRQTGELKYLKKVWGDPEKEKRADALPECVSTTAPSIAAGGFWAGAMNDPAVAISSDEGVVFRLDPDLKLHRMIEGATIPNSIGWSADNRTMFFTDTPTKTISKFDYDAATGNISNRRAYFRYEGEGEDGAPDGFAIDVEGCLWTAIYGAAEKSSGFLRKAR
ncbi:hypothetical protein MMC30_001109 [Trapelia coarctata]|nr:hypothetical protein [Trapelia coarctata]